LINHVFRHYWEQAAYDNQSNVSLSTIQSITNTYNIIKQFKDNFKDKDWYVKDFNEISLDEIIGN